MHSFYNQALNMKSDDVNNFETIQKARQDLVGEIQAIIEYDNHLHSTPNNVAKNVWNNIKIEELNHVGELLALLSYLDHSQTKYVQDGINEYNQMLNNNQTM